MVLKKSLKTTPSKILLQNKKLSKLRVNLLKSNTYKPGAFTKNFTEAIKFRTINGKKILLGKGTFGKIYLGDVKFQDGSKKKVAIKVYNLKKTEKTNIEIIKLQEEYIKKNFYKYENVLKELKRIKIPKGLINNPKEISIIPKCEVFLVDNQIVFVSQAFSNLKENVQISKFTANRHLPSFQDINYNKQKIYLDAVVSSLGGVFTKDMFMRFKGKNDFIFLDLDTLVFNDEIQPKHRAGAFINSLLKNNLDNIKKPQEKKELLEFTKKIIREDKNNFNNDFKSEVYDLLENIKL